MKSEAEKIKELLEKIEPGTGITIFKTSSGSWFARFPNGDLSRRHNKISETLKYYYKKNKWKECIADLNGTNDIKEEIFNAIKCN